tara:strand:- start:18760 stop:18936 length:177 start_codon:yes stop_codon:yes gene_type:complete
MGVDFFQSIVLEFGESDGVVAEGVIGLGEGIEEFEDGMGLELVYTNELDARGAGAWIG